MIEMLDKVHAYKQIQRSIEELEAQKKLLGEEILELMPNDLSTVHLSAYRVQRVNRLSIRISVKDAEAFEAVKTEKVVDREKIKQLFKQGENIPGVSEINYIQVYSNIEIEPKEE